MSNSKHYIAWCCSTHLKDKDVCPMKYIKETDLQQAFMTVINKLIFGRKEIVGRTIEILIAPSFSLSQQLDKVEGQIKDCQANIENLTEFLANELIDRPFYQTHVNRLETDKKVLLREKEAILKEDEDKVNQIQELKQFNLFLEQVDYYKSYNSEVLVRFLDYVEIVDRNIFCFHLKCGLSLKERSEN